MEELLKTGARVLANEPMASHTTLCVGGPAEWYVEVDTVVQLRAVLLAARKKSLPVFFLGWGSNLLVADKGIRGITLRLKGDFISVSFEDSLVRAGAGVFLPTLVKQCADKGLGGIEPLVGIPGTIGGALIMNAGTRDLEIGQVIKTVEVLNPDGNLELLNHDQIRFEYRASSLAGRVVCFATLQLRHQNKDDIIRSVQVFLEKRLETQPISNMNVGSIFKNPPGNFAARLIEQSGLKGRQIGQAQVSPKHANFIVNLGGAKANDVKSLIELVQKTVAEKHGVKLETEVKMVGL
ncbi:MAG: UDP-N-acetylenolpyruvoylglucosamine reductase [Elusimicrobia bacterium RIFCSPLOWO2_01_FULL_54_10]|nr:MAG: UDP-N-acetylenolpyruvoylglucosamine reductase [Elusimicrobia bacterium RIFCSPLOWO2_01_FULL_54_10]